MSDLEKLYDIKHSYYCSDNNYFSNECTHYYKSWIDFYQSYYDADIDYNLIFRWDWIIDDDCSNNDDIYYKNGKLFLFFIRQRKGIFSCEIIDVCKADEPQIKKFLKPYKLYMKELWVGIPDE